MTRMKNVPSVSVTYAQTGGSTKSNELGMRAMQERAYEKRGEQYLLIKSPPASGKSRALMFIALDKLENQGVKQAIVAVPEKTIGASFNDELLSKFGFWGGLGRLSRNGTSAIRLAQTVVRSNRLGRSLKAMIAFWYAPMPRSALPWTSLGLRRLTIG